MKIHNRLLSKGVTYTCTYVSYYIPWLPYSVKFRKMRAEQLFSYGGKFYLILCCRVSYDEFNVTILAELYEYLNG